MSQRTHERVIPFLPRDILVGIKPGVGNTDVTVGIPRPYEIETSGGAIVMDGITRTLQERFFNRHDSDTRHNISFVFETDPDWDGRSVSEIFNHMKADGRVNVVYGLSRLIE